MMFRLLFTAAVGDCYLNGPCLREEEKLVAMVISIIAVLLNEQYAFILAELAWFAVFARAGWDNKAVAPVGQVAAANQNGTAHVEEKKANECPPALKKAIDHSLELFLKNKEGDKSCDGETWELMSEIDGDKIWRAKYPGESIFRWRARSTLYGPLSGILAEMFDYAKRAGPGGWDPNLAKGRIHKEYDGGYKILVYSSNPVMGGLISPREFIEGRIVKPNQPGGEYLLAGVGLDQKTFGPVLGADFPAQDKNCTPAKSFPGGGFCMSPVNPALDPETPQEWHYTLVANTAIGGWIPTSTINTATAQVLTEATKFQKIHMNKRFKPSS